MRFFKLFEHSTLEGSSAAAGKMRTIPRRQDKRNQKCMLLHCLHLLIRYDEKKLGWPSSPLLVLLQFLGPNVLSGDNNTPVREVGTRVTPLLDLANLLDLYDCLIHENQLILAKQLIEHGANVNAVSTQHEKMPLHNACFSDNVTNLDFVQLLLKEGADPNAQDNLGETPLLFTTPNAPGAAKFLMNWPTADATTCFPSGDTRFRSGISFLISVRSTITDLSRHIARPDTSADHIRHEFLRQQGRDIEKYASGKVPMIPKSRD